MATAHKIAVIFYTMVKKQVEYNETLWDVRDAQREKRLGAKLKPQAKQLGYETCPHRTQGCITRSSLEAWACLDLWTIPGRNKFQL